MHKHHAMEGMPVIRMPSAPPAFRVDGPAKLFGVAAAGVGRWLRQVFARMVEAQQQKASREIPSHVRCLSHRALMENGFDAKQIPILRAASQIDFPEY